MGTWYWRGYVLAAVWLVWYRYMQAKKRKQEFAGVVGGMEWPLNIVFRPGNSEDNAVAWRG